MFTIASGNGLFPDGTKQLTGKMLYLKIQPILLLGHEDKCTCVQEITPYDGFGNGTLKITATSPRGLWVKLKRGLASLLCWGSVDRYVVMISQVTPRNNIKIRSFQQTLITSNWNGLLGVNSSWPGGLAKMGHFYHHTDVTKVLAISRRFGCRLWTFNGAHGLLRVLTFNF